MTTRSASSAASLLDAMARALRTFWPKHTEGTGGYPPTGHDTHWQVYDALALSDGLPEAILAALRADPAVEDAVTEALHRSAPNHAFGTQFPHSCTPCRLRASTVLDALLGKS